jgi:putative tricarboxylic transport membrane protein
MEVFESLRLGFIVALTPTNLFFCAVGVIIGTLVGVMPGLGPAATIAMLMPLTFGRDPAAGLIMLAGIYYGAKYGGAVTSILVNLPGESSSVMTCLDGYQMAKQGRGGKAIGLAAIGGFVGGTASVIALTLAAPPLAAFALTFGPPEYFALLLMGLTAVTLLAGKSMVKALMMGILGLMLAVVGIDEMAGVTRFDYDQVHLLAGIAFPVVAIGFFAIAEVLVNVERTLRVDLFAPPKSFKDVMPAWRELRTLLPTYGRASVLGFFVGVLPGAGATIASFLACATERALSKQPEKFGTGVMQGVAGPETADNAASGGALVPLLTLGVPGSGSTAMLLAALMMLGLRPGPLLIIEHPQIVWGLIASLYIGNILLLVINLPLAPLIASVLRVPYPFLYSTVLAICLVGVYSLDNSLFDVWLAVLFGGVGYFAKKLDYPAAPAVLALVLGPMVERAFRQSLVISRGDYTIFLTRPIAVVLLAICLVLLAVPLIRSVSNWNVARKRGEEVSTA